MQKEMTLDLAKKIEKETTVSVTIDAKIVEDEFIIKRFVFWCPTMEYAKRIRKDYNLGTMEKKNIGGTKNLEGLNFELWTFEACKIIGYKEEIIPEHLRKTPIYKCD